ncbi:hypothetical protein BDZ89DRAFT_1233096 [Hymenopellis radicata]|nr:hypothetical protein BDZ89DRAFT_1233096 [Hymenopellis radicata]
MDISSPPPPPSPVTDEIPRVQRTFHPYMTGKPCDVYGNDLPADAPPPPRSPPDNPYEPFAGEVEFRLADFTFRKAALSEGKTKELLEIFQLSMESTGHEGPFKNPEAMYTSIDDIPHGSAPWKCFLSEPPPNLPADAPAWLEQTYEIWYRTQIPL